MTGQRVALDEIEHDALTELVNIGVSRAAMSLRKMVEEQVLLSVPSVEVVTRQRAVTLIRERENDELIAVSQDFAGVFSGRALLIFPEKNSLALVRAVTHGTLSDEEAADLEDEALAETGNIVLNGCLASMANMLKKSLTMSLPQVIRGGGKILFELDSQTTAGGVVLFLYINFTINDRNIRGYIAMLMDVPSIETLKTLIGEFIARAVGGDATP
jgi:chemotaxis protein CheC